MSSPTTNAEILALAFSDQENYVPTSEERRGSTFLSLAPHTDSSYPSMPVVKSQALQTPQNTPAEASEGVETIPTTAIDTELLKTRRSSSLSSDGGVQKRRFLKLGPVHYGESSDDYSEEVLV